MIWNASPEIVALGPLSLRWYGVLFAASFFLGFEIEKRMFNSEGVSLEALDRLLVYMFMGTLVGARLGHCLFYEPEIYLADPIRILKVWEGGLASHGGVIGIFIAFYFGAKKTGLPYVWILDRGAIAASLGAAFIRIGNLFNSEILGKPTDVPWAVTFSHVDNLPRHPSQVYESLCYFLTLATLWFFYKKPRFRDARGFLIGLMLVMIFTARFFIEFLKERQVAFENTLPLDMGQLLSIPMILAGVLFMILALRNPLRPIHKEL